MQLDLDFSNSSAKVNPVTTVGAVTPEASRSAVVESLAPGTGRHTLQAQCGSAATAEHDALGVESDNHSSSSLPVMSPAGSYVASRVGGDKEEQGHNFSARRTYVQNALDLIDGATVAIGTRLAVRKNQTTQTIGTKESYCPACQLIFASGWANYHLSSKQHQFTVFLCTVTPRAAESEIVT